MITDDKDMKIAGDDFVQAQEPDDTEATAKLLNQEKANGNLGRARRLGAILAEDVAAVEGDRPLDATSYMTQRRILMAFAVEVGLDTYLPRPLPHFMRICKAPERFHFIVYVCVTGEMLQFALGKPLQLFVQNRVMKSLQNRARIYFFAAMSR